MNSIQLQFNSPSFYPSIAAQTLAAGLAFLGLAQAQVGRSDIFPANSIPFTSPTSFPFDAPAQVKTACRALPIDPYSDGIERIPQIRLEKTPRYLHQFLHPEIALSADGKIGFPTVKGNWMTQAELQKYNREFQIELKNDPELKRNIRNQLKQIEPDHKGFKIGVPKEDETYAYLLIGFPKEKRENHETALAYLRSWVGTLADLSPQEIAENMIKAHAMLFKGTKEAGTYRKQDVCVFKDNEEDQDRSFPGLSRLLLARGGTKKDVAILKTSFEKKHGQSESPLTKEEKRVWSYFSFITPDFETVPNLMLAFAKDLKETACEMKRCGKYDPIALGAYVHQKINAIHPFSDGNGRTARALMNAIFMENGVNPIIFPDEPPYTDAVEKDAKDPGSFADYLRTIAIARMEEVSSYLEKGQQ